ncbi:Rab GTPase domain-containing protein [Tieghemostelium lacteum]|uniref:Rab GTPase domain-containing protein n=1 Tax=Tieghemostelium lacteum TaxID=361077 RepID=A0A151ZI55_TIELA|nr:Rab GTPase domain-containing protein [Tieghemostelium lacteum]|eukprot:KYQ93681.1 Rab GTPase domain-containing protein [Tieghemostelium lacteum]
MSQDERLLKLLILGDRGVGKTSLLFKYVDNQFKKNTPITLSVDFKIKNIEIDGKTYKVQIWDTSGQEQIAQITSTFYKNVNGIIVAYDTTNRESFNRIQNIWLPDARRYAPSNTPIVIAGCKSDLENRQVLQDVLSTFSNQSKIYTFECSSLTGDNVDRLFDMITKMAVQISYPITPTTKKKGFKPFLKLRESQKNVSTSNSSASTQMVGPLASSGYIFPNGGGNSSSNSNGNNNNNSSNNSSSNQGKDSQSLHLNGNHNNNNNIDNSGNAMNMNSSGSGIPNSGSSRGDQSFKSDNNSASSNNTPSNNSSSDSVFKKIKNNLKSSQQVQSSPKSPTSTSTTVGSPEHPQQIVYSTPPDITENFKKRRNHILSIPIPIVQPHKDPNGRLNYYHSIAQEAIEKTPKRTTSNSSLASDENNTTTTTSSSMSSISESVGSITDSANGIPFLNSNDNSDTKTTTTTTTTATVNIDESSSIAQAPQKKSTTNLLNDISSVGSSPKTPRTPIGPIITSTTTYTPMIHVSGATSNSSPSPSPNPNNNGGDIAYNQAYGYTPSPGEEPGEPKNWHKNTLEILPTIASKSSLRLSNTVVPKHDSGFMSHSSNSIPLSSPFVPVVTSLNSTNAQRILNSPLPPQSQSNINNNPTASSTRVINNITNSNSTSSDQLVPSDSFTKATVPISTNNKTSIMLGSSINNSASPSSSPSNNNSGQWNELEQTNNNTSSGGSIQPNNIIDSTSSSNSGNNTTSTTQTFDSLTQQTQSMQLNNNNNMILNQNHPQQLPKDLLPTQNNYLAIPRSLLNTNSNNIISHQPITNRSNLIKSESQQFNLFKQAMTLSSNAIFIAASNPQTLNTVEDDTSILGSVYEREDEDFESEEDNVVSAATLNKEKQQRQQKQRQLRQQQQQQNQTQQQQTQQQTQQQNTQKSGGEDGGNLDGEGEGSILDPYGELNGPTTGTAVHSIHSKNSISTSNTSNNSKLLQQQQQLQRQEEEEIDSDLNERFQRVVLRYREFPSLDTNLYRLQEICTDLLHISQDFIHTVKTYGRIIIEERYLKEKTIQSKSIGGHLGGDKYIVRNVLFKFSGGSHGVNDEWGGAKVGGQELKGCMATLNCPISGLCVPLMALVDFMGFRLIAMSVLPISSSGENSTIVYGSSDMGRTVHADEKVIPIMKSLSHTMNLKAHYGGINSSVLLYSATDVEGHIGTDGRFYLIDFSRTFPPTYPDETTQGGHLFQLFRPEFLKSHPKPLCSDAFSGFLRNDPDRAVHNQEVKEASHRLLTELIPRLSVRLKWMIKESLNNGTLFGDVHIPEQFHRQGINMRWIGHMMVIMDDRDSCFVLLIEAIARVLKNDLRKRLRESMKKYNQPMSAPYIDVTTKFLNMVFGSCTLPDYNSEEFWEQTVKNELASKFYIFQIPSVLTQKSGSTDNVNRNRNSTNVTLNNNFPNNNNNYLNSNNNNTTTTTTTTTSSSNTTNNSNSSNSSQVWKLQDILNEKLEGPRYPAVLGRHLLFTRFRDMTHLKFRKKTIEKVSDHNSNYWNPYQPFDTSDLKKIGVRVKHTDLVTNAEGTFFYAKAMTERSISTAIHLLHKARKRFELALISNPNNKETLQLCAQTWCKILEFSESQGKNMSNVRFSMKDRLVINTDRYFLRAIDADPKGPLILFFYANFLVRCERYEKAEDYFLRSLEADSNNYRCLTAYANFLTERGFPNESSHFLERAKQCKAILVGGLK